MTSGFPVVVVASFLISYAIAELKIEELFNFLSLFVTLHVGMPKYDALVIFFF